MLLTKPFEKYASWLSLTIESGNTLAPLTSSQGWGLCPKHPGLKIVKSCAVFAVFPNFVGVKNALSFLPGSHAASWPLEQCCICLFETDSFPFAHKGLFARIDWEVEDEGSVRGARDLGF